MQSIYKLQGVVQPYAWGGTEFLPALLHIQNKEGAPFAEYWMGTHSGGPAQLINGQSTLLAHVIEQDPESFLGSEVAREFGTLPFLLKILDVRQMLSIQVHPDLESAKAGYQLEEEQGIPKNAPHRNYKDQNHKPELMVAFSDFWLLHGFKPEAALKEVLEQTAEFRFLLPVFGDGDYKALYADVMNMPQEKVDAVLAPLMNRLVPMYQTGSLSKNEAHFWAARGAVNFCKNGHYDRGLFSIYFFNLVFVKEGEGVYQPAGLPHAYLEGQNVEVMAASDNVLRAGLTDKHMDVAELLKHVRFEATHPAIIRKSGSAEQRYDTAAREFLLSRHQVSGEVRKLAPAATIVFVYRGDVTIETGDTRLQLSVGEAAFIRAGVTYHIRPKTADTLLYSATTPL